MPSCDLKSRRASVLFICLCSGLQLLLEGERAFRNDRPDAQIILRQILELLEQQTVEPWSFTEVETASVAVQRLLRWHNMDWLQVRNIQVLIAAGLGHANAEAGRQGLLSFIFAGMETLLIGLRQGFH